MEHSSKQTSERDHVQRDTIRPVFDRSLLLQKSNLRIDEAAALCGVHENTMRRWLSVGKLAGTRRSGGSWRVPIAALKPYL